VQRGGSEQYGCVGCFGGGRLTVEDGDELSVGADAEEQVVVGRWRTVAALGEDRCALTVSASDRVPRQVGAEEDLAVGEGVHHTVCARWGCDAIDGPIDASGREQCGGQSVEVILGGQ
jgi:hypothetical protein